ncbi:MAG TPA: GntR family transcriptional regulator, partial [Lachnospiraceae bacterium]|nr:GntR family transcriptional regulator [Lachnospiraceae bacterium]
MEELLYVEVSNKIESGILSGKLKENDKLSERSLAEGYGVSRSVVRDALKLLNEKGLVTIKTGKGHYVSRPSEADLIVKVGNAIDYSAIPMTQILEAREQLEHAMAGLMTEHVTQEDLTELTRIYGLMEEAVDYAEEFVKQDELFHITLLGAAHNDVLQIFIRALNGMINRNVFLNNREIRMHAQKEHKLMLDAL